MNRVDGGAMTEEQLGNDVVLASWILANEGGLDGSGHVSARLPGRPDCFLRSRARAPELVEPGDLMTFDADSELVAPTGERVFAERLIHGEICRVRADVMAILPSSRARDVAVLCHRRSALCCPSPGRDAGHTGTGVG
jgi:ribulose-5-phosphate 4-epimerase/fuculose-1-phosphate aldolase